MQILRATIGLLALTLLLGCDDPGVPDKETAQRVIDYISPRLGRPHLGIWEAATRRYELAITYPDDMIAPNDAQTKKDTLLVAQAVLDELRRRSRDPANESVTIRVYAGQIDLALGAWRYISVGQAVFDAQNNQLRYECTRAKGCD